MDSLKLKEWFVTGHTGSTILDILLTTSLTLLGIVLRKLYFKQYSSKLISFFVDFILVVVPLILLLCDDYLSYPTAIVLSITILVLSVQFLRGKVNLAAIQPNVSNQLVWLTTYRSYLMLLTCICILAVDFKLFPRRFCKVETFGVSIMDLGVGAFVFSSGVVNGKPKFRLSQTKSDALKASFNHSLPLFMLGIVRLISVKGLEYQEHVSEYGVHWNFFFTLATIPTLVTLLGFIIPNSLVLATVLGLGYQLCLNFTSLQTYILYAPRMDLVSMNREGLASSFGYVAIFLIGKDVGYKILTNPIASKNQAILLQRFLIYFSIFLVCYIGLGLDISRRLANLPYVLFIAWFNVLMLLAFCTLEQVIPYSHKINLVEAINFNQLFTFLLANLLTGLINMNLNTLAITTPTALEILFLYMLLVTGIPYSLYLKKFKVIKF